MELYIPVDFVTSEAAVGVQPGSKHQIAPPSLLSGAVNFYRLLRFVFGKCKHNGAYAAISSTVLMVQILH